LGLQPACFGRFWEHCKDVNTTMVLQQLVFSYSEDFNNLANWWLSEGAGRFGIRDAGRCVVSWPDDEGDTALSDISEPIIHRNGSQLGELFVTQLSDPALQEKLKTDADFVARLASLDGELDLLAQELVESQDQLVALYGLMHSAHHLVSIDEIVNRLTEVIEPLFEARTAFMVLQLPERPSIVAQSGESLAHDVLSDLVFSTLERTDYLLINDRANSPAESLDQLETVLAIPMSIRGEKSAVLGLVNNTAGPFQSPTIKLLRAISDFAVSRIESALMYEAHLQQMKQQTRLQTEMELAHDVQMSLMPQTLPQISNLEIATFAQPALSVGGDFYDYFIHDNDIFYFTLGDISGKGMSAALLMAMTRTTMRNTARLLNEPSPKAILDHVTDSLYDDFTEVGMFCTIFTGLYDATSGKLAYVNGGHSPVIFRRAGGHAHLIDATGPPLCVLPQHLAYEDQLHLAPGDLLIVATDGFNEARNGAGEMFDYERLLDLVDALADQSAQNIADRLVTAVAQFSEGQPQDDDQTIIVIKRNEHE